MKFISYKKFPSQLGFTVTHSIIFLLTLLIYSLSPCTHNLVFNFLFCMQLFLRSRTANRNGCEVTANEQGLISKKQTTRN